MAVPHPSVAGRLALALAESVPRSLRPRTVLAVAAGAALVSAALAVPQAGVWLASGLGVVAAWCYGVSIREGGIRARGPVFAPVSASASNPAAPPTPAGEPAGPALGLVRLLLGALAVAALVAPFVVRNAGRALPTSGDPYPFPGARGWMALVFAGWLVAPLLLLAAFAHDRHGRIAPGAALLGLARHPVATLAGLLTPLLGLLATECLIAFFCWQQGFLPLIVSDLYPPPTLVSEPDGAHLHYNYDGVVVNRLYVRLAGDASPLYWLGASRGFALVGTIPASLTLGTQTRTPPALFRTSDQVYFGVRFFVSVLILAAAGLLLAVQARWLGVIASLGYRRKGAAAGSSGSHPAVSAPVSQAGQASIPSAPVRPPAVVPVYPPAPAVSPGPTVPTFTRAAGGASTAAPAAPAATSSHFGYPYAAPAASSNGAGGRGLPASARPLILIVEDELAVADAVARILVTKGFGVLIAADGEEGLRQARAALPDLIVLDLLLPTMLGMEVCRALRSGDVTRRIPIIMATCADTDADELAGLNVGADDYVAKPYSIDVLVARIQKQLHRRVV